MTTKNSICKTCGKAITTGAKRCYPCFSKTNVGETATHYKHGRYCKSTHFYCKVCNKEISPENDSGKCMSCVGKGQQRNYKDGRTLIQHYCKCGTPIVYDTWKRGKGRCLSCLGKDKWKDKKFRKKMSILHSKRMTGKGNPFYGKTGNNHPNWNRGSSFEPYGLDFTKKLRIKIRKNFMCRCQICGKHEKDEPKHLDIHHIDYNKKNNEENNLISLCHRCHVSTNHHRQYWIEYFKHHRKSKFTLKQILYCTCNICTWKRKWLSFINKTDSYKRLKWLKK